MDVLAPAPLRPATTGLVWLGLGIVYVVWGSTYLAIRVMVRDLPPLLGAGCRFVLAGVLLALVVCWRTGPGSLRVSRRQLAGSALIGLLLPAGGNGLVTFAEQNVPSGIAALILAIIPLWIVVLRSLSGDRPRAATWLGVLVGFVGLALLVLPTAGGGDVDAVGVTIILVATVSWATGSWLQPRLSLPASPFVTTTYEMLAGGTAMVVAGLLHGEAGRTALGDVGWQSAVAWLYLVFIGSMLAYSAYVWLLGHAPLSLVATYAYVNPVVAVFLGWVLLAEPVTAAILLGGAVIVVGVAIVVSAERPRPSGDVGAGEGCETGDVG